MIVLGLCGSLRRGSYNRRLLRAAASELPLGVSSFETWQTLELVPPYNEDLEGQPVAPAAVEELREALSRADGVLIATPEHNASIPGQLKNALDWASRPFPDNALRGKPVAVIGASTGLFGAVWAQAELRKVLAAIGAHVLDEELPIGQVHDALEPDGSIRDPALRTKLSEIVGRLVRDVPTPAKQAA